MIKNKTSAVRYLTIFAIIVCVSAIVFVVVRFNTAGGLIPCMVNKVFNINCPTCGATRAVYYFFTLHFAEAFYYHAYFVTLSPIFAYLAIAFSVNGIVGRKIIPLPAFKWYYPVIFLLGLMAFGVLRNFTDVIY